MAPNTKKTRAQGVPYQDAVGSSATAPTEPAPPAPTRTRAEIGAELMALQIAYHVTASGEALKILRATADEYLETFR